MWIKNDRIARFMLPLGAINSVVLAFQQAMAERWWWMVGALIAAALFAYFSFRFIKVYRNVNS